MRSFRGALVSAVSLLSVLLLVAACGSAGRTGAGSPEGGGPGGGTPVTLTLNWYPYGEHAPFYYGIEQGIYAKHGIDLTVRAGQGSGKTVQAVGGNQTDFGWASTPALLGGVASGVPAKSVGVFLQTSPASVQFFCSKNFTTPRDLKGAKIASTAGDALSATFPAFLQANDMTSADVRILSTDPAGKLAAVMSGRADALLGFAHDQGPIIQHKSGKDICYLRFPEHGVNYHSNGLIASNTTIDKKPELVSKMVAATSEAFTAAAKKPEKAVASMAGVSPQLPAAEVLLESWKETMTLLHTERTQGMPPGVNIKADWQHTIDVFSEAGELKNPGSPSQYWTAKFAPKQ